ncbi:MAG: DNA adenine methylase [Tomitella sp.]|nr:DNA adenine methylase [Tomitella sp.]
MPATKSLPRWISPLRYPGGKVRMTSWLVDVFTQIHSSMDVELWIEPFGGGAGAALMALTEHAVPEAWIVEHNPALAAFWQTIMSDDGKLAHRVEHTTATVSLFTQCRDTVAAALAGDTIDWCELAYAAFVVNRCSRSGMVLSNVGPIGGAQQQGRYTVDSRFNGPKLADRIRAVTSLGERFRPHYGDGIGYVEDLDGTVGIEDEVFLFVDPPYVGVGNRLYTQGMTGIEHERLAHALEMTPAAWVATYDAHPEIAGLYRPHRIFEFAIPHTAHRATVGSEYLIAPHHMSIPGRNPLGKGHWQALAS